MYKDHLDEFRFEANNRRDIKSISQREDYYFDTALDLFVKFKQFSVERNDLNSLIAQTSNQNTHDQLRGNYQNLGGNEIFEIVEMFASFIGVNDKTLDGKYATSPSFYSKNEWIHSLLKYKRDNNFDELLIFVKNSIRYIFRPNKIAVFAEDSREMIYHFFGCRSDTIIFECMHEIGIKSKNSMNDGYLYSELLHTPRIRKLWDVYKGNSPVIVLEKTWAFAPREDAFMVDESTEKFIREIGWEKVSDLNKLNTVVDQIREQLKIAYETEDIGNEFSTPKIDAIASASVVTEAYVENDDDFPIVSELEYEEAVKLFDPSKPLDRVTQGYSRTEQAFLRENLFGKQKLGVCGICGKEYPVFFLVAAHLKRRASCTYDERLDYRNIAIPMCKFGCDDLYEKGYITVINGKVELIERKIYSKAVLEYINSIRGKDCPSWNDKSEIYFEWHRNWHDQR